MRERLGRPGGAGSAPFLPFALDPFEPRPVLVGLTPASLSHVHPATPPRLLSSQSRGLCSAAHFSPLPAALLTVLQPALPTVLPCPPSLTDHVDLLAARDAGLTVAEVTGAGRARESRHKGGRTACPRAARLLGCGCPRAVAH